MRSLEFGQGSLFIPFFRGLRVYVEVKRQENGGNVIMGKSKFREYKRIFYSRNKVMYGLAIFTTAADGLMQVYVAVLIKKLLDVAIGGTMEGLWELVLTSLGFILAEVLILLGKREFKPRFVKRAVTAYRNKAYGDITDRGISDFGRENTGNYVSALTNDVTTIENNYLVGQFEIVSGLVMAPAAFALMVWYSPRMTLAVVLLCALPVIATLAVGEKMAEWEKKVSEKNAAFMAMVKDLLNGFGVIKSFQAQQETAALYQEKNSYLEQIKCKRRQTEDMIGIISITAGFITQIGVFCYGAYLGVRGQIAASIVIAFVQMMNYVINPINTLPKLWANRKAAVKLIEKMASYGENVRGQETYEPFAGMKEGGDGIFLKHVGFSYEGDKEILKDINLHFEAGKSYAIVGASGSGKSTLLNLVMGSYPDYEGSVTLDGKELKGIDPDSIFDTMSVIQQNVFIFDDTIKRNICMFKEFDAGKLDAAIEKAGLSTLMEEKGEGYACGENGSHLSGGEKQRIAIARSLLRQVSVLLVDEATSALDAETSDNVTNSILDIQGVTRLVVTHKLDEKALRRFDEIIVMKSGKVTEQGDFDTLMGNGEYFASLYRVSRE